VRRDLPGLIASAAVVVALSVTASMTLGGFTASISDQSSKFTTATLQLEEGAGATTCYTTGTGTGGTVASANTNSSCAINVLTGTLDQIPGGTSLTTTITLTSAGNKNATSATLTAGSCSAAAASDDHSYVGNDLAGFCGMVDVTIANTTTGATDKCVYPTQAGTCPSLSSTYTLASLASQTFNTTPLSIPVSGTNATYVISVQLDSSATNADQGLAATLPFTWSISQ
jgi:hypothetical protein